MLFLLLREATFLPTANKRNDKKYNFASENLYNLIVEPTLKRGIFWTQSDQCGHSEWNIAIGSAGEYLSRNCLERAESFSYRPEKGKYRSLKCWNLEYYHPSEVHPHTSAICMHTMFEQAPVSGLAFREQRLEYLLINLGCHETIKLVVPWVGVRILLWSTTS